MNEIIICEKRKAAEAIANSLGKPTKLSFNKVPYFHIKDKNIYVVPLRGHIKEYRNTEKYKSWSKSDPREILIDSESIFKYPSKYANNYIRLLEFVSKKQDIKSCIIGYRTIIIFFFLLKPLLSNFLILQQTTLNGK